MAWTKAVGNCCSNCSCWDGDDARRITGVPCACNKVPPYLQASDTARFCQIDACDIDGREDPASWYWLSWNSGTSVTKRSVGMVYFERMDFLLEERAASLVFLAVRILQ